MISPPHLEQLFHLPFQLCLNIADTKNGGISGPTSTPLALWSVPEDGKKHTFTHEVWVDKTWTPWIGWENGPWDRSFRADLLVEKTLPNEFRPRPDKKTNKEKFIYSFKLIIYVIPMLFSLAKSQEELDTSTSQAGDDIYPIF